MVLCLSFPISALAAEASLGSDLSYGYENLSKTDIEYDFKYILAGQFKVEDYIYNGSDTDIHLITAIEGTNSSEAKLLYVYLYNPSRKVIQKNSDKNTVTIAKQDTSYSNFKEERLYLQQTYSSTIDNNDYTDALLLKFSVSKEFEKVTTPGASRYYRLGELEIIEKDESLAKSYVAGKKYCFFDSEYGYSSCSEEDVITSEVFHTYYRYKAAGNVGNYNDIRTVYFPVPTKYIDEYGKMDAIRATWNEYASNNIIVTDNAIAAKELENYVGNSDWSNSNYSLLYNMYYPHISETYEKVFTNIYNYDENEFPDYESYLDYIVQLLFPVTNLSQITTQAKFDVKAYRFTDDTWLANVLAPCKKTENENISWVYTVDTTSVNLNDPGSVAVPAEVVLEYFENNKEQFDFLNSNDKKFYIYEDRSSVTPATYCSGWNEYWNNMYLVADKENELVYSNFIQLDKEEILKLSNAQISSQYMINIHDVAEFKNNLQLEKYSDCTWFMLRYDITDYYVSEAALLDHSVGAPSGNAIVARTTIVEDFDIIESEFDKDGVRTIFAYGINPTNAATDITTHEPPPRPKPENNTDFWNMVKTILIIVLICMSVLVGLSIYFKYIRPQKVRIDTTDDWRHKKR